LKVFRHLMMKLPEIKEYFSDGTGRIIGQNLRLKRFEDLCKGFQPCIAIMFRGSLINTILISGAPRTEPSMKMLSAGSPVESCLRQGSTLHSTGRVGDCADACVSSRCPVREGRTLSGLCPRDTGCSPQTRGIANLTLPTSKIPISRTTRARLYMKHGFSAHPRLSAPYLLLIQTARKQAHGLYGRSALRTRDCHFFQILRAMRWLWT